MNHVHTGPSGLNPAADYKFNRSVKLNCAALSILFVGYTLTTGTAFISTDIAKVAYRIVVLLLFISNILLNKKLRLSYLLDLFLIFLVLAVNKSEIAANIVFLIIASASMAQQSAKESAISFALPVALVVIAHGVLYFGGLIVDQQTSYIDRQRSTLGFSNANQVSGIYLSFAIIAIYTYNAFKNWISLLFGICAVLCAVFVFQFTDSRTSSLTLIMLIFLQFFAMLFSNLRSYRLAIYISGSAAFFFGTVATYYITTSLDAALDLQLSFRPYFFALFMSEVPIQDFFWGWPTGRSGGTDNGYLMLLSGVGAIVYVCVLIGVSIRIFRTDHRVIPIMIVLLAGSVFESFVLRPEIPASVLFFHLLMSKSSLRYEKGRIVGR